MDLNISETSETGRVPYNNLSDEFLQATLIAINETVNSNLMNDDEIYSNTKLKVINEIQQKFVAWQNESIYTTTISDIDNKSRVAVSELIQADLMLMGPDEQMSVKGSMRDTYDRCIVER